ncbi:MAG TPA: hypothetical protein VHO04_02205 [Sphingopyxis sp.]|jgi:hypothetical protein|uniref:hypothetical protein n=1 Tax=Sphingopyxis sp. TaxID=1908224 RepID=UPI002E334572|nr:hypothetical protein [Sphingopyxis sp.]HEX2811469.1 hypothetical protein [Sphingopyxis sp.]
MTLLISFGAGVEAPDCASACGDPAATGRWIVGLSLIIFLLPLIASTVARLLRRRHGVASAPAAFSAASPDFPSRLDRTALRGMVEGKIWETA